MKKTGYKIFIVEDDEVIGQTLKKHLEKWDYQVTLCENYKEVLLEVTNAAPDLVLLDINLPYYNGFYWCTEIRRISKIPIIFLSSASDNMNIVMAMNMGGDDFIAKPFDVTVLTAKIHALLRRSYAFKSQMNVMEHEGVVLNISDCVVTYEGKQEELSKNEYSILKLLMEHAGETVSRDTIMEKLWDSDHFIDDNTLTVNVTRIRKKLNAIGAQDFIKTKKGMGYLV